MCEHVVARPPASAATAGPAWPPVTATVAPRAAVPVRVLAADRPQLSPITIPPEALLLSWLRHSPALRHEPPIDFGRVRAAGSDPFSAHSQKQKVVVPAAC